jgi:crotonobetainyl-CoA:carnitine CoA-transferase CaiB-like acyl-CoA transferase
VQVFTGIGAAQPIAQPVGGVAEITGLQEEKKYPPPDSQADSISGLPMLSTSIIGVMEEEKEG